MIVLEFDITKGKVRFYEDGHDYDEVVVLPEMVPGPWRMANRIGPIVCPLFDTKQFRLVVFCDSRQSNHTLQGIVFSWGVCTSTQ